MKDKALFDVCFFLSIYAVSILFYLMFRILGTLLEKHSPHQKALSVVADGFLYLLLLAGLLGWLTVGAVESFCYKHSEANHIVEKYLREEEHRKTYQEVRRNVPDRAPAASAPITMEHLQTEDALSPAASAALRDYLAGIPDDDGDLQAYSAAELTEAYVELRRQYRRGGSPDLNAAAEKAFAVLKIKMR